MSATSLYKKRTSAGAVASTKYFPTTNEVSGHLKLIKAFDRYKRTIVNSDTTLPGDIWKVFLIFASRRFIVFMSACFREYGNQPGKVDETKNFRHGLKSSNSWIEAIGRLVPPLDVCMVWYSYLVDSGGWYDRGIRGDFMNFINFPFPIEAVAAAIDGTTFEYRPTSHDVDTYMRFITNFSSDGGDQEYHISNFSQVPSTVFLWCPNCGDNIIKEVAWTNRDGTGFADPGFSCRQDVSSMCNCPFSPMINHDELRKRTFYYFIKNNLFLPGIFKHWSEVFHSAKKVEQLQADMNKTLASDRLLRSLPTMNFGQFAWGVRQKCRSSDFARKMDLVMGPWANTHIVFTTGSNTLTFTEDFVQMISNCEPFFEKVNQLDWVRSPAQQPIIDESIGRYRDWLATAKHCNGQPVFPTVDIDLVWRTHQLAPFFYFDYMENSIGYMIDETFVPSGASEVFSSNAVQFRGVSGKDLAICKCQYCISGRSGWQGLDRQMAGLSVGEKSFADMSEKERMAQHYQKMGEKEAMGQYYQNMEKQGMSNSDGYGPPPGPPLDTKSDVGPPTGPPPDFSAPSGPPPDFSVPSGPPSGKTNEKGGPPVGPPPEFSAPSGPPPDFSAPSGPPPEIGGPPTGPPPGTTNQGVSLPPGYSNISNSNSVWMRLSSTYPRKCNLTGNCECRGTTGCGGGTPSCRAAKAVVGEQKRGLFNRLRK